MAPDSSADRSAAGRAADRAGDRAEDLAAFLREETTGGQLLLGATALALLWANLSEESYRAVWDAHVALGPEWLQLDLSLADWAADGLLAVFFFVAGMEVKRELTVGELADRRSASLPLLAALGGMVVPALVAIAASGGAAAQGGPGPFRSPPTSRSRSGYSRSSAPPCRRVCGCCCCPWR